jgi:hypothetical protein
MPRIALLMATVALSVPACGKKKLPPPPPPPAQASSPAAPHDPAPARASPRRTAPAGIPQEFFDLFQSKWPEIEKGGQEFSKKFTEAQAAQRSGDRAKMSAAIDEASRIYRTAKDSWAEIAYWPLNNLDDGKIDQKTNDRCERFLRKYGKTVTGWDKKAKALKEFSTVK